MGEFLTPEQLVCDLKAALHRGGIVLPSLQVDTLGSFDEFQSQLIDLGRVNLETASRLVSLLSPGAEEDV